MFKALNLWLPSYLTRTRYTEQPTDLILCVCDHFEPRHGTDRATALERVRLWQRELPKLAESFRDSDSISPRHTFFFPVEQYDPEIVEIIARICQETGAETEIHLHHKDDSADHLLQTLQKGKADLAAHGLLSKDSAGQWRFGFIHGNWALDNSHPRGRHCGVVNELRVLKEAGCYADFTMPSAPDPTQTRTINQIYYAKGTARPKSHDTGVPARVGSLSAEDLLMIQGPLGLNWERRKWGLLPRLENADLTRANPPTADRLRLWQRLGIHVEGRPEWLFIKLHTHGAIPSNSGMLLGGPMRAFHRMLASLPLRIHYVSAREMVNMVHAAEDGKSGNPGEYRDYRYRL